MDTANEVKSPQTQCVDKETLPGASETDSILLIQINIYGNAAHSSTRVKVTPTLTAGDLCVSVAEKNGILKSSLDYYSLVVVYTSRNHAKPLQNKPLHHIRTIKAQEYILDVIKAKEAKTEATIEATYTTKWYVLN